MADKTDWVVEGFQFATETDASLAKKEQLRIRRIEDRLDYGNLEMVYAVYKKAIENRVFKTPVGYEFLKRLQNILLEDSSLEKEIYKIPVYGVYNLREGTNPTVEKIKASTKKAKKKTDKETFSKKTLIVVNIGLIILIIVMFVISTTGTNPTVLNYEKVLQNRYSEWEKELSEREQIIREKEKELLLDE